MRAPVFCKAEFWWPGAESNCRHADFQSAALPTELPGQPARALQLSQVAHYSKTSSIGVMPDTNSQSSAWFENRNHSVMLRCSITLNKDYADFRYRNA